MSNLRHSRCESCSLEGYLAHKTPPPPQDTTVALCLGTFGDPRGVGVSHEQKLPLYRGTSLSHRIAHLSPK